jgi:hypothetical protein
VADVVPIVIVLTVRVCVSAPTKRDDDDDDDDDGKEDLIEL